MRNVRLLPLTALTVALPVSLVLSGCGEANEPAAETPTSVTLPETLFLTDAPTDEPQNIGTLVAEAGDGDPVVVRGRIGGRRGLLDAVGLLLRAARA